MSPTTTSPLALIVDDSVSRRQGFLLSLSPLSLQLREVDSIDAALHDARAAAPELVCIERSLADRGVVARLRHEGNRHARVVVYGAAAGDDPAGLLFGGADEVVIGAELDTLGRARIAHLLEARVLQRALEQQQVELRELMRARDEMSSLVVHDLKSPLAALQANLELALDSTAPDRTAEMVRDALVATRRLGRLVQGLHDLTRLEQGKLRPRTLPIGLGAIMHDLLATRAELFARRGVRTEVVVAPSARVVADVELLSRVVDNLLDNALRYTPDEGLLRIWYDGAVLRIGNSGPPVPPGARESIFEKFGQAQGAGRMNLGLGLYFCRLAVESLGGQLWYEEGVDLPSTFALSLPTASRSSVAA